MAVTTFDRSFSFKQDSLARLGRRHDSNNMSAEERQRFMNSPFMKKQEEAEALCWRFTSGRDERRAKTDRSFKPKDTDFQAPKAHDYKRGINYYKVLGIDEYAPLEEVKKSYKKLSLIYHPDKTANLSQDQKEEYAGIFIELKNAYLTLSDNPTRRQYDRDRDRDKASYEINGFKSKQLEHFDATELLRKLQEAAKPPGKTVNVPVSAKLEKFFYGGHKRVQRERKVKDFEGFARQTKAYRIDIPAGATEPHECAFRKQGDHHQDTMPDTLNFKVSAKPHAVVQRQGENLVVKGGIQLPAAAWQEPYLEVETPSVGGRHLLIWGQNPFYGGSGGAGARLVVTVKGEGMPPGGVLRLTCTLPAAPEEPPVGARPSAPSGAGLGGSSRGPGGRPSLKRFLERHGLLPPGGLEAPGSDSEEEELARQARDLASHWAGGLCDAPAMRRRLAARGRVTAECAAELVQVGEPLTLFTTPTCSLALFSGRASRVGPAAARAGGAEGARAPSLFALVIASPACARRAAAREWESLLGGLRPALRLSALRVLSPDARAAEPRPLAEAAAWEGAGLDHGGGGGAAGPLEPPWKLLGDEAFRRAEFFTAMSCYCRCRASDAGDPQQDAVVASNLSACLAKIGQFEESISEAERALQLRPDWARPWMRIGFAATRLGREDRAREAYCRTLELDPCMPGAIEALESLARLTSNGDAEAADAEAAHAAKERGNVALQAGALGLAAAHYTVGLSLIPAAEEEAGNDGGVKGKVAGDERAFLRSVLHANRAAAFCRLGQWDRAVADAERAVSSRGDFAKARIRLGAALLGRGCTEQAYVEFARALQLEPNNRLALEGRQACLAVLPLWRSLPARRRFRSRFGLDLARPSGSTKVYAISDVHFDHRVNEDWAHRIDDFRFREDVLLVAGNLCTTRTGLVRALTTLKAKFRRVFYVPGNREMWLQGPEASKFPDSLAKLLAILEACDDLGVDVFPAAVSRDVFVIPMLSWYHAEFDTMDPWPDPSAKIDEHCKWPLDADSQVWKYLLRLNEAHLRHPYHGTVISLSHFVPSHSLPYSSFGKAAKHMGCEALNEQVCGLQAPSRVHLYGHSHRRHVQYESGILYVNHYHGEEGGQDERAPLFMIYDGRSVVKKEIPI